MRNDDLWSNDGLWGGSKAIKLFNNNSLSMHKTSANLLRVLKDYCCKDTSVKSSEEHYTSDEINEKQQTDSDLFCSEDNELFIELSCNRGTFDDEILYFLGKADQDNESHKVCNEDIIAKSDFDDLRANNSPDIDNINNSSSSTISSNDNIDKSEEDSDKDYYSDNLLISEDSETDQRRDNLLVSGDIDNGHYSHNNHIINGDTSDDHNQSNEDEPLLDNSDMDFLGKSCSAKDDIKFLPDLFNGVRHLQCECERNLLNSDDIDKDQCSDNLLGSGERILIDNLKTVNDDKSVNDNPYELNFLGSCDPTTMVQAVVLMKGLDACFMAEGNPISFVREISCNLRDFVVNGWPNSKTEVPVSKLCHWFLQDELGYYSSVLMKGS